MLCPYSYSWRIGSLFIIIIYISNSVAQSTLRLFRGCLCFSTARGHEEREGWGEEARGWNGKVVTHATTSSFLPTDQTQPNNRSPTHPTGNAPTSKQQRGKIANQILSHFVPFFDSQTFPLPPSSFPPSSLLSHSQSPKYSHDPDERQASILSISSSSWSALVVRYSLLISLNTRSSSLSETLVLQDPFLVIHQTR